MAADLIAAGPHAAGSLAVARLDERLCEMRLHEPELIDAVLRGRALGLVHVLLALVVVDRGEGLFERRDCGRANSRRAPVTASPSAERARPTATATMNEGMNRPACMNPPLVVQLASSPRSVPCFPSTPMSTSHFASAAMS